MEVTGLPFEMKHVQLGNHAFEGLNNCYVLGTEPGAATTLVDTGISTEETREQLRDGLGEYDLSFGDVDRVLLTHHHGDHVGLAGEIQDASGASVHVHEGDAPLVRGDPDAEAAMRDRMETLLGAWGMPEESRGELLSFLDSGDVTGLDPELTPFEDGDRFDLGPVTLEAVHLPGHSVGLSGVSRAAAGRSCSAATRSCRTTRRTSAGRTSASSRRWRTTWRRSRGSSTPITSAPGPATGGR